MALPVLLVSGDAQVIGWVRSAAQATGADVEIAGTYDEACRLAHRQKYCGMLVHVDSEWMPSRRSDEQLLVRRDPPVIVISRAGSIREAVAWVRAGAREYVCICDEKTEGLAGALTAIQSGEPPKPADILMPASVFVSSDYRMQGIRDLILSVADSKATVLIEGESGTGKTLIARMLHERSSRRDGPFMEVSCGAVSETLIESELFGHARGAFTSAHQERAGKFELADGGTLLLDEINNASAGLQRRLLRVIESGDYSRLGETETRHTDVRLIVASNAGLEEEVSAGRFREDLFHRVNSVAACVPPLRERVGDVPLLARHFLDLLRRQHRRKVASISSDAMDRLVHYPWPGNVRELRNVVEHGTILAQAEVMEVSALPQRVAEGYVFDEEGRVCFRQGQSLRDAMREPVRRFILDALRNAGGNKQHAARDLRISRSTLYKKMKELGLETSLADWGEADWPAEQGIA